MSKWFQTICNIGFAIAFAILIASIPFNIANCVGIANQRLAIASFIIISITVGIAGLLVVLIIRNISKHKTLIPLYKPKEKLNINGIDVEFVKEIMEKEKCTDSQEKI